MGPKQVGEAIETLCRAGQSASITAAPGVGKTSVVGQTAKRMGGQFIPLRLLHHQPSDFKFPVVDLKAASDDQIVRWVQSVFPSDRNWTGIILLDEYANTDQLMQGSLAELFDSRRLGGYELPAGAHVHMASNRIEDRAGANRVLSSLNNRVVHINYEVSHDDWREWALTAGVRFEVREFVAPQQGSTFGRPNLLLNFKPELSEKAWPSPRAWEKVSRICDAVGLRELKTAADSDQDALTSMVFYSLIAGTVGQGPAAEFIGHLRMMFKLPDRNAILSDPMSVKVPQEPSVLWALCGSLVDGIKDKKTPKDHLKNFAKFCGRMPGEFATLAIRDGAIVNRALLTTPEGSEWIRNNRHLILPDAA